MLLKINFLVFTVALGGDHNADRSEENEREERRR